MKSRQILIPDDSEILEALQTCFLGRGGFSIVTVQPGDDVFHLTEEHDPLLAIVRGDMISGENDYCRRVKRDPLLKETPIILVLPPGEESEDDSEIYSCYDAVLRKPFNSATLRGHMYRLLGIRERKFTRYDVSWRLFLETAKGKRLPVEILDISEGGAFVRSERLFPVDTFLTLKGTLSDCPDPVGVSVRVAWTNHPEWLKSAHHPQGMGLEFDQPPSCLKHLIARLKKG